MRKLVVMADNHGDQEVVSYIKKVEDQADYYIHCGDSQGTPSDLEGWIGVRGNNDYPFWPNEQVLRVEDLNILIVHGHRYGYFNRESKMINDLKEHNCDVLIFGHLHIPFFEKEEGFIFINPGSTDLPRAGSPCSYCVITIEGADIDVEFKEL